MNWTSEESLHFAQPIWLLVGLLVCAALIGLFMRFDRRRDADLARLIHPRFRQRLTEGFSPRLRNLKRGLWLLAVWLAFVAIARPQMGYEWREVKRKGIDILFAVDTSRSMLAEDLTPNRLERARLGILDFVARLEGDRVGLIPFAGSAFALCPLTLDYDAFRESLNALHTDLIPRQGTDLASAIKESERLFDENGNNHRVLVLLTDGEDLQGDVIETAKTAAKNGMAIYTVGVGSPEGSTIPVRYRNGRTDFVRDEKGQVVKTTLDESTLRKIAETTNALYAPLGRGAEGLNTIYQERLRLVPKSELNQRMERIPLERFEWPLGAAIALLLLGFFIGDRRRMRGMNAQVGASRIIRGTTSALMFGMLGAGISESRAAEADARMIYNQGTDAYVGGDFAKAAEVLKSSLRTPDLKVQQLAYYNLGNSLYRTGQGVLEKSPKETIKLWEESIKAYEDVLSLNGTDEDAKFNKALVTRKLEEIKKQQNESKDGEGSEKDKEEQKKEEQKKEEQKKEEQKKEEQKKEEQKSDKKDESKSDEKSEEGKDPKESKDPKSDGKSEEAKDGEEKPGEKQEQGVGNERGEKQEMTKEEARQLLEALRGDERTVIPLPQQPPNRLARPDNSTKGKTW
jgi:Ca-activated chloride channel family protein